MIDPYKVLGVAPGATEDEIKKAYKTLSRKYHPDANINNPHKEQAEEKFKEIQAAYQQIMNERKQGGNGYGSYAGSGGFGGYTNSGAGSYRSGDSSGDPFGGFGGFGGFGPFGGFYGNFYGQSHSAENDPESMRLNAAANYINSGHFTEALNVLSSLQERNAKWYFYSALANNGLGNNIIALDHAKRAYSLEPDNIQYQQLLHTLESGGTWYQGRQQAYGDVYSMDGTSCCRTCITLMCLSSICRC